MSAFPYDRAAFQLSVATLFGYAHAAARFGTSINTLHSWGKRAKRDEKLKTMLAAEVAALKDRVSEPLGIVHHAIAQAIIEVAPKLAARGSAQDALVLAELYQRVGDYRIALEVLGN